MALAPKRPCKKSGCSELTLSGYCEKHSTTDNLYKYDNHRGSATSRGYDADWRRVRLLALQRDKFICQHCLPRPVPAEEVHHEIPINTDPSRRLDLTNLTSLCKTCHSRITATQRPLRKVCL
ncbi:HNH endonuclease [Granulicella mallensis]|uniref:HNH endonuclease n=1 Tax=Granulicella mallensis TaxID=940614 RepID=UPI0016161A34